jgi:hypothetical protein
VPRALTRPITRKQALSYERTIPNKLGVTALAEVNGRRAYARRYAETKRLLAGRRPRSGRAKESSMKGLTPAQKRAMTKMSPARKRAFAKMLAKAPSIASLRRRRRPNKATHKPKSKGRPAARKRARGPAVSVSTQGYTSGGGGFVSPVVLTPGYAYPAAALRRPAKRPFLTEKIEAGMTYEQAQRAWDRAYGRGKPKRRKARKPRAYGARRQMHPISIQIGKRSRKTYLYRTRGGKVRHIPQYALLGYPSAYAMKLEMATRRGAERGLKKSERLSARREKAAAAEAKRIRAGRGIFSPNRSGKTMSWQEWTGMYGENKRRGRKKARRSRKLTRAERATISRRNLKKARAALRRRGGHKRTRRHYEENRARRRRHVRRYDENRRGKAKSKKRLTKAQRRAIALRNLAKGRRARKAASRRRKSYGKWRGKAGRYSSTIIPTRGAREVGIAFYKNRSRRGRVRRYDENRRRRHARRYDENRARRRQHVRRYDENRRHRRVYHRRYRSNAAAWVSGLKEALKVGAIVVVGYLTHRALTKVLSEQALAKIGGFGDGTTLGNWRDVISGLVVAAIGVPLTVKFIPGESAAIAGGMAASFLHGLVIRALHEAGQDNVAGYLAGYPDAPGKAYPGIGSYYRVAGPGRRQLFGMGEYLSTQPDLRYNQLRQPMAGLGGGGARVTQAAAGTGEYLAFGAQAMGGDYQEVPMLPMPTMTSEGVMPTLDAAENALNIMEAAAGVGAAELPMQSDLYPQDQVDPIGDEPGGSRSGVFSGGGGIFGG